MGYDELISNIEEFANFMELCIVTIDGNCIHITGYKELEGYIAGETGYSVDFNLGEEGVIDKLSEALSFVNEPLSDDCFAISNDERWNNSISYYDFYNAFTKIYLNIQANKRARG